MISKSHKFPLRTEFVAFRSHAKRLVAPHFQLMFSNITIPVRDSRLSVIVPKKVSKLATTRNWLKRLTYDATWPLLKDRQLDCVVIYKPPSLTKSPATQKELISELTQTIGNL